MSVTVRCLPRCIAETSRPHSTRLCSGHVLAVLAVQTRSVSPHTEGAAGYSPLRVVSAHSLGVSHPGAG